MASKYEHADRAKQFAPFDALRGLHEALKEKEKIVVEKPELSEERLEELDRVLNEVQPGAIITVVYYENGEFVKKTGMVSKINREEKKLFLVKTPIAMNNIVNLEV